MAVTKTITNTMMRRRLKQITSNNYTGMDGRIQISGETSGDVTYSTVYPSSMNNVHIYTASYNRIQPPSTIILDDGRTAQTISPVWNLQGTPSSKARQNSDGIITLDSTRNAEILEVGERRFVLSHTQPLIDAMELELHCGDTSIKLTGDGVDIKAQHVTINGREYK